MTPIYWSNQTYCLGNKNICTKYAHESIKVLNGDKHRTVSSNNPTRRFLGKCIWIFHIILCVLLEYMPIQMFYKDLKIYDNVYK